MIKEGSCVSFAVGPMPGPEAINRMAEPRTHQHRLKENLSPSGNFFPLSFLQQYLEFKTSQRGALEKRLASGEGILQKH